MGDTVKVIVTQAWTPLSGLILGRTYGFQNIVMAPMFLRQQSFIPDAKDTGHELLPFKTAILIKETNNIFVRMKTGNGVAYFNELL